MLCFFAGEIMKKINIPGNNMIVYEFYRKVLCGEDRLIGVLPERRKDKARISHQSIMNWARLLAPEDVLRDKIYFIQVDTNSNGHRLQY